jgi:hypothetical protein
MKKNEWLCNLPDCICAVDDLLYTALGDFRLSRFGPQKCFR